jgi:hypothetical protein
MNRYSYLKLYQLLIIFPLIFLFPLYQYAQNIKYWPKYDFPHIEAENSLWIGTPKGLYQYHSDEDSWTVYTEQNGLPSNHIQMIRWDEEYIWITTPQGIAYGDIKLNKWTSSTDTSGVP